MIIACDFDGTICVNKFPEIGEPIPEMVDWLKKRLKNGDRLILWTCREGEDLDEAVAFCKKLGIEFVAVNENDPAAHITTFAKHKIYADIYLDDRALNPLDVEIE
jgi:hydroxymethylpyrimidine pyrophosphatase-like HAD family hydrolase